MSDEIILEVREVIQIVSEGIQGPAGPPGNSQPTFYFNYGDATPAVIFAVSGNLLIKSVRLIVLTAFNGVGAQASIGTDSNPNLLMGANENYLAAIGSFESAPNETVPNGTLIKVFITPGAGATQGRCGVLIEYASA